MEDESMGDGPKTGPERRLQVGYALSSEEHGPAELVRLAQSAEAAGFAYASLSDHFHPWIDAQGHSPFAWSVLGGIAQATTSLQVGTGVTCPTGRYHPAVIAQAAATIEALMPGRFFLGVGTGENLNEHITGQGWPPYQVRAARLEEAVSVIRALWGGEIVNHQSEHFTVANARLYDAPEQPPPIIVAAGGDEAAELAGRIADGLINYAPDPEVVKRFRNGRADDQRPCYLQVNVCWDESEAEARRLAHRLCPTVALPGELGNLLPTPAHYEQAVQLVEEEDVAKLFVCGPDPDRHVEKIQAGFDAGYDHVHVYQAGPNQDGFFRFYERDVLPRLR
jgi:coenzyme F420-dependent glucose-6-phosphate dehydrogenase